MRIHPESEYARKIQAERHTPNGYDPKWVAAINNVLQDRETGIQITDITEQLWDEYLGPMIDAIEDDRHGWNDLTVAP